MNLARISLKSCKYYEKRTSRPFMEFLKKCSIAFCIVATVLGNSSVLAAESDITVRDPQVKVYVQGTDTVFPNEQGLFMPAVSYNNSTYIPVRSAGEWMGKQVAWDGGTQTVLLSGTQQPTVHKAEEASTVGATSFGDFSPRRGGTAQASLCPDISVSLDGVTQTFKNEQGTVIYPIRMANVTYLPLRSIGELTGYEVTWEAVREDPNLKGNIYLRKNLLDSEKSTLLQYTDTMLRQIQELDQLVSACTSEAFEAVASTDGVMITTLVKPDVAAEAIPKIKAKAEEIQALGVPAGTLLNYYYGRISANVDGIINHADAVLEKVKQGQKIQLGGMSDLSRDEDAVSVFSTSFSLQTDAQYMRQMITQKMEIS